MSQAWRSPLRHRATSSASVVSNDQTPLPQLNERDIANKCFTNLRPFEIIPSVSRKSFFLLVLCVIAAIAAYRIWGQDFDWSLFLSSLSKMKAGWLAASVIVTLATYWLRALRWQILLAPLKAVPIRTLLSITVVGFSAIFLLGRAGEVARPLWLTRREKVALTGSVATIVVERVLDMIMLTLAFGLALISSDVTTSPTLTQLQSRAWIVAAVAGGGLVALFVLRSHGAWLVRIMPVRRLASLIESFLQGLSFLKDGRSLGIVAFQSALLWVVIAMQFWFMLLGMNFSFSAGAATLVMVGAAIGSIAQVPGIGGGFQAGYIFCMTALMRVPLEQAVATSLIATVFSFVPTVLISPLFMVGQDFSLRNLKTSVGKPESEPV